MAASTRKLYERRLQKLLDHGPPEAVALPVVITQVDSNHNGNSDSDRYSDKEEGKKRNTQSSSLLDQVYYRF